MRLQSLFQDERWPNLGVHGHMGLLISRMAGSLAYAVRGRASAFHRWRQAGNMWLSEDRRLLNVAVDGHLAEEIPWSELRRIESASALASGRDKRRSLVWFLVRGGVSYFKDGQLRESYTIARRAGEGAVQGSSTRSGWGAVGRNREWS